MGELPIPPYLNRETQESDKTTYQTVYSKIKGSVAAPTAGLHFINGTGISATLIHNMKWSDQESDKAHKTAFLSSLLLQIYAQLFTDGVVPVKLNWSYPSAMSDSLVRDYDQI